MCFVREIVRNFKRLFLDNRRAILVTYRAREGGTDGSDFITICRNIVGCIKLESRPMLELVYRSSSSAPDSSVIARRFQCGFFYLPVTIECCLNRVHFNSPEIHCQLVEKTRHSQAEAPSVRVRQVPNRKKTIHRALDNFIFMNIVSCLLFIVAWCILT